MCPSVKIDKITTFEQKISSVSPPVRTLEFNEFEISNLRTVISNRHWKALKPSTKYGRSISLASNIFKVLSDIRSDIASKYNQLDVFLTKLKTSRSNEKKFKDQFIPPIHKVDVTRLSSPKVRNLNISIKIFVIVIISCRNLIQVN